MEKTWIALRQFNVRINIRMREITRRILRKLVEIALTDMDLMDRLRDPFSTAEFEAKHLSEAASFKDRDALFRYLARTVTVGDGLCLEFGVYKGDTINRLAELFPKAQWVGFDSFEGLPEAWTLGAKAGAFDVGGRLPAVRDNVTLIKGFYDKTLPGFVAAHRGGKAALMHIDCDLYSSTLTALDSFKEMIGPGTVITFDELINYPGWQQGEYKAFMEFVVAEKLGYEFLAYVRTGGQVAVRVTKKAG